MDNLSYAYISGALTNVVDPEVKRFYEMQAHVCEQCGIAAYVPHKNSDPQKHADLPATNVYRMDKNHVRCSRLVIVNATFPSLGVGQEIEIASQNNIPILLLCDKAVPLSRMTTGNPHIIYTIRYKDRVEALSQLTWFLSRFLEKNSSLFPANPHRFH